MKSTVPIIFYNRNTSGHGFKFDYEDIGAKFNRYDLKVKDRISIYMNFWLFTYDDQKITPYEMLILLRKTPGVRLVMFNRKLDLREH
ncbi:MAG: hypothetical protein IPO62_00005 [Saprospiraceae bacterium]|nr:hypothetical protein [Saprospiraceae bacterium]